MDIKNERTNPVSRREFIQTSSAVAATGSLASMAAAQDTTQDTTEGATRDAGGSDTIRVGLIGCGGRGTGAAVNALEASERIRIAALADVFRDRLDRCRDRLTSNSERGRVPGDRCYTGFDAYRGLITSDVDMVILATPPHFRPIHLEAAVAAGKHVFMEKPVAVDPTGVRTVIAAADQARVKNLSIVAGTQRRHEACYLDAMRRVHDGAIGDIVSARCAWNMGGLWMKAPRPEWTDMEWQLRNWLYFTWLSGDHIVEQHIHNLDVCNWAIGAHPVSCMGMGGRQVRTDADYGHIFDHFAIEYVYPGDVYMTSMCRQTDGCASRVSEAVHGTEGVLLTSSGSAMIKGANAWRFAGKNPNPYVQEHRDLVRSISGGPYLNEGKRVAESTLTAIMGRLSAYTGREVTWEQVMHSTLDLAPAGGYVFGEMPMPSVAVPGKTPLV